MPVRSLRGRLTLGITLMLAIVLAGAGVVVSRYVDRSERAALDDRLKATAELSRETALASVDQSLPASDRRLDQVLTATGSSLRLLLGRRVLVTSGKPPEDDRPPTRDGLRTFGVGGEHFRTYVVGLERANLGGFARLEITTRLGPLEDRVAALNRRLAAFGIAALVVAGIGVWLVANLLLRPLRRLQAATASIAGTEDLDRRVRGDDGAAELRSLAASFNDMLARLDRSAADRERALAATRRFTADAGHELRTPLTSVQATLSALSRHPDIPSGQRVALVRDALAEHRRLVALLDGLQALARGEAAAVQDADVDLAELVATAVEAAAARHPDVFWSTELPDEPVLVRGWEPGLRLLADNLLENAGRHGRPAAGSVVVRVGAGPALVVDDDGPGIGEADRERIFEPFVRANGSQAPGSGLGLALVAQQIRHHGATIDVSRSPLGGARFSVRFGDR
ncbi:MAG: two-component system, OmpR family, sensor histidine kinase PrrB [Solirubrobacteraceae bacterium]|nr:two-component system, OmpR family, sensor histidine kinase PrrB [Solirubrobacteraceae bacterium]